MAGILRGRLEVLEKLTCLLFDEWDKYVVFRIEFKPAHEWFRHCGGRRKIIKKSDLAKMQGRFALNGILLQRPEGLGGGLRHK